MSPIQITKGDAFTVPINVTGTSFRQPSLDVLAVHSERLTGMVAALRPEPTNPYDPKAVAVDVEGVHVAYLPRDWREGFDDVMKAAVDRLLEGEGELVAELVRFNDDAGEPRWTVRLQGEFK